MSQSIDLTQPQNRTIPVSVYVVLFFGVMAIAVSSIFVKLAQTEGIPSLLVAASRLLIAAALLTPLTVQRYWKNVRNLTRRDFGLVLISGFFLALHFASWVTSLEYTSVLISVVFVTSSPLWVALLEFFFLKAHMPRLVIMGLVIAIIGGLFIGLGGASSSDTGEIVSRQRDFIGGVLSLVGAVSFAVYLIIGRKLQQGDKKRKTEKLPIIPYIWLVYGTAGLILAVPVMFMGIPLTGYSSTAYLWLIATAVVPQLIGHSSLNYAVGYMPATLVSMITQLEPIGSAILAYFIFSELPLPLQIFGSMVIICGVMLATIGQRSSKQGKSETS
jgi:drug/metabolite transporter (DMT)-like permease